MPWRLLSSRRLFVGAFVLAGAVGAVGTAVARYGVNALNAFTSRKGYSIRTDLRYAEGPRHSLDLYVPEGAGERTSVVVFFYGGAWHSGAKEIYLFVGQALAAAGFIVAVPDYRIYPEVTFPAFMTDAAEAVAWVHANVREAGGAARPLILAGHSAGAHIAMLLNFDGRYLDRAGVPGGVVKGAIGLSGPYDFLPLREDIYKAIFPEASRPDSQPIRHVVGDEAPVLLLTGDADETVDPGNSTRLADKVRAKGGSAEAKLYPGVSHLGTIAALAEALPIRNREILADMVAFIRARTGGAMT